MTLDLLGAYRRTGFVSAITYVGSWWLTMCGLDGRVETFLAPRRKSVGDLKPGRMLRDDRANVLDSIVKFDKQRKFENRESLFLRNFLSDNDDARVASPSFF
jgi:hypothetical protein